MTNAQKYEEVFGFPPDKPCPTILCQNCPLHEKDDCRCEEWWDSEYKEPEV